MDRDNGKTAENLQLRQLLHDKIKIKTFLPEMRDCQEQEGEEPP